MSKTAAQSLAKALSAIDFSVGLAELEQLQDDLANATKKDSEVREEALRLDAAVRDFAEPEPSLVVDAILAGKPLSEATTATPSRADLIAQRDALRASLAPLRKRIEELRGEIGNVEHRERLKILAAAEPYLSELEARQRRAAEEIAATHAGIEAIAAACRIGNVTGRQASKIAIEGIVGGNGLLYPRDRLPVRLPVERELRDAFEPISRACDAIRGQLPTEVLAP